MVLLELHHEFFVLHIGSFHLWVRHKYVRHDKGHQVLSQIAPLLQVLEVDQREVHNRREHSLLSLVELSNGLIVKFTRVTQNSQELCESLQSLGLRFLPQVDVLLFVDLPKYLVGQF